MSALTNKLMGELDLAKGKGVCYGMVCGFPLSVAEAGNLVAVSVAAEFQTPQGKDQMIAEIHQNRKLLKLAEVKKTDQGFSVTFAGIGAHKRVHAFLEWLWPQLERLGGRGDLCPLCGLELSGGLWCQVGDDTFRAHSSCLTKAGEAAAEENREARTLPRRRIRGLIGAVLGAAIGSIPWIIAYYAGWFVAVFGLLIALSAKKGYELLGGRPSWFKLFAVLVSTVCAVLLSVVVLECAYMFIEEQAALSEILYSAGYMMVMPEFWLHYIADLALGLLFAILGCAGLVGELRREVRGPLGHIRYLESKPAAHTGDFVR